MKRKHSKRLNSILVVSMIGMGAFSYIPTVHAEGNDSNQPTGLESSQSELF